MKKSKQEMAAENMKNLPYECYANDPVTGEIIRIVRGIEGYYQTLNSQEGADNFNQAMTVTAAQKEAMLAGSVFGFHVPAANPDFQEGILKRKAAIKKGKSA